ncbi:MAG: hypothetical protein LBE92_18035 [Chryseobacterium sp.]|jgi:hypothetical protein|uniref:hypothetical protein n=1 Tax=Chryseobacterium sp. TaxID=1871047 RepID=UPI002820440E|nr:hypothetical protein [Chryseobacterium sp.]MDR2238026.1 hypothetical protein [Chryseobacterium sp.]
MNQEDISRFAERNLKNFSVNSTGWYDLIRKMLFEFAVGGWNMENDVFGKEKFGELRCYIHSENRELDAVIKKIVDKYSALSVKTCEICGNEGKMRTIGSWQTTLCLDHFLEQKPVIEIDGEQNIGYRKKTILNLKQVVKAEVELDLEKVRLYTRDSVHTGKSFYFSWQEPNYYLLLKTIPLHVFPEDSQSRISELFQNLENCEICGHKAVHQKSCLRCCNEPWGVCRYHTEDYGEKSNYIKNCQMDIFIDEDDYEKYFKYDRSFEKVPDHQILFTHTDLRKYESLLF